MNVLIHVLKVEPEDALNIIEEFHRERIETLILNRENSDYMIQRGWKPICTYEAFGQMMFILVKDKEDD